MKTRLFSTVRAWIAYINTCRPAAFAALLLLVLLAVCTAARVCFNAGAAHALESCRVYSEGRVRIVYGGRIYDHNY